MGLRGCQYRANVEKVAKESKDKEIYGKSINRLPDVLEKSFRKEYPKQERKVYSRSSISEEVETSNTTRYTTRRKFDQ